MALGMALGMVELAQRAKEQLALITGFTPVAVVGASRDNGEWKVTVDLLEIARIPEATDLLGTYVASLDAEGHLVRFDKKGSRLRGEPCQEESP